MPVISAFAEFPFFGPLEFLGNALGTDTVGEMIDATLETVRYAAAVIADDPNFELLHEPELSTLVFRYQPARPHENGNLTAWTSAVNDAIRDKALASGDILIARTQVDGISCLKITLLNPAVTHDDIEELLRTLR